MNGNGAETMGFAGSGENGTSIDGLDRLIHEGVTRHKYVVLVWKGRRVIYTETRPRLRDLEKEKVGI